jgi:hypothetical protein
VRPHLLLNAGFINSFSAYDQYVNKTSFMSAAVLTSRSFIFRLLLLGESSVYEQ